MPVKKNNKKATTKKSKDDKKKKVTKKIKKVPVKKKVSKKRKELLDIKKAVKDLPSILAQEMKVEEELLEKEEIIIPVSREQNVFINKQMTPVYKPPQNSQKWLWSAVVLFTVIIFSLWILNVSNIFYESKNDFNGPLDSLKNSKEDLKVIFNTFEDKSTTSTKKSEDILENKIADNNFEDVENKVQKAMTEIFQNSTSTNN